MSNMAGDILDYNVVISKSESQTKDEGKQFGLVYYVEDNPPWILSIFLGLQHYLTMFGATVAVPIILSPHLCIDKNPVALSEIISTIFFISGIATLLQTTFGIRLPIVQGATFSFLGPTIAILSLPQFKCPSSPTTQATNHSTTTQNNTTGSGLSTDDDWRFRMLEVQGAIMVASLFQIFIVFSGLVGLAIRFVGPLTIAPTVALIGLSLFEAAGNFSGQQWGIAVLTVFLVTLFSQVLKNIGIPLLWFTRKKKCHVVWVQVFKFFPILLGVIISWSVCAIITAAGGFPSDSSKRGYLARTDVRIEVLEESSWIRVPYPGQWGTPTVSVAGVFGMLPGVLASMIESIGDYYACARLSGAPPPPGHAINRGIGMEGILCLLAGAWGSGNGTTSFGENIGAIGITKVGSRRVVQVGAVFMMILAILGKFGALFTTIPDPVLGGMFWVLFGMIFAVGISSLQHVDLNSSRNLFVFGFSFFTGMVVPTWLQKNPNAIDTGNKDVDQIISVLLKTNMAVGGIMALVLDNVIPGTLEERGMRSWNSKATPGDNKTGKGDGVGKSSSLHIYDVPFLGRFHSSKCFKYIPFLPYYENESSNTNKDDADL